MAFISYSFAVRNKLDAVWTYLMMKVSQQENIEINGKDTEKRTNEQANEKTNERANERKEQKFMSEILSKNTTN